MDETRPAPPAADNRIRKGSGIGLAASRAAHGADGGGHECIGRGNLTPTSGATPRWDRAALTTLDPRAHRSAAALAGPPPDEPLMRILLVHNLPPWDPRAGGGQRIQHEIAVHAAAAGHDVRVLYSGDGVGAPDTPYRMVWAQEHQRLMANAVALARAARRLLAEWRPEVVHASAAEAGLLPLVLPPGVPLVATSHHPDPPALPPSLSPLSPSSFAVLRRLQNPYLEAHLLRRAHRVVATSAWGADILRQLGYMPSSRPVAVVHNGVGEDWMRTDVATHRPDGDPTILCLGRIEPAKGWDVLLAAMARSEAPRSARIAFVGTGPDEHALSASLAGQGLSDRVELVGWLDPPAIRDRLSRAIAMVLPSRRENYPLVLLEAMAAGVPVVTTRVGGIPEMIDDGRSGLLVPPDDPSALATALARVCADEGLRDRLIEGGREVAERHRWDRIVAQLVDEYRLARELARPVPRPAASPLSDLYRRASARAASARAPRGDGSAPPDDAARIALVRPGRLGDLLLTDPLVAALEERYPRARIELITDAADRVPPWMLEGRVAQRTLALRRGPDAWRRPGDSERGASLGALAEDWATAPPDVLLFAVDLADPIFRLLAAELTKAAANAWRAGLASGRGPFAELHAVIKPGPATEHESVRLLRLAAAVGAPTGFRLPRVPSAQSPLPPWPGPTLVVHPGASRPKRRWPLARWSELAARLGGEGIRTVVVGDRTDREHVPALGIDFDDGSLVDRVGALDLLGLAAVLGGADVFAGNDSFPFHLATAAGTPALVLVGPGAARWWSYPADHVTVLREPVICSPRSGEECPVCTTCPHGACMQSIRLETVVNAVRGALTAQRAR